MNIPVRRLADAELADSFTVVHTGSEQVVLKWASAQIVDFSRDDLALDLRSSAPPEAFAFLACRDGLATLMLRDDSVADGWSTKIYWLSDLPRMFTLS
ncbi:hypothetical protein [Ornithinimicrobium sp. INDO-MA30-4]|uniref:hypothetical protein n=1 Tax=Ornithinimicrobium sp. INDO-MA30-4 TaxID=2908651 RepID=UPI001F21268B|nr:hypothetical protein [Ornithinimicrobium sp. INDO-MA30-4]UJH70091.1 hypothetical protein L0A91_12925 [Ornithinimicrobium sp. INDO-MA30-4]